MIKTVDDFKSDWRRALATFIGTCKVIDEEVPADPDNLSPDWLMDMYKLHQDATAAYENLKHD